MSEQPAELVVDPGAPSSFADILGFLAPESNDEGAGQGGAPAGPAGAGGGQQPAAAQGAGGADAGSGAPAGGDGGVPPVSADGSPAPITPVPAAGQPADTAGAVPPVAAAGAGADPAVVVTQLGDLATAFETRQSEAFETQAFVELQTEYPKHFEAVAKHPRLLVGQEVPSTTGPGMERLRDSADAADWQEAMKQLLAGEAASRVEAAKEAAREVYTTVHSSITLFQNNPDLIPRTRGFDKELADEVTSELKDFELRKDGKLIGYSVPVQPVVNAVRKSLVRQRAAAAPAAQTGGTGAAPSTQATAQQLRAAEQARTPQGQFDGPQAGIRSQAGSSAGEGEETGAGVLQAFLRQNGVTL